MTAVSMYQPIWEALTANKQAMLVFPDDELNVALAMKRTRKGVIRLKDNDKGFKATSHLTFRLKISSSVQRRELKFWLIPCESKLIAGQL